MSALPVLKVGDVLHLEVAKGRYLGRSGPVTVVKVGRDWATLSNGRRARKHNWMIEGATLDDVRLFSSEEACRQWLQARALWRNLTKAYNLPPNVTPADVREAARLLGLESWLKDVEVPSRD